MPKWKTAEEFIEATIGRSYDMDTWPKEQPFQCWDYGDYFWLNQVGRSLITKSGGKASVRDCWNVSRKVNAGNDFELITDKTKLKKGDWVIFNSGGDGHIGIVKSIVKAGVSVMLQGENQGSTYVNVINRSLSDFLGAFRYKGWNETKPKPAKKTNEQVAKEVIKGLWGNGIDRKNRLEKAGYNYNLIQSLVNKLIVSAKPVKKTNEQIAKEVIKGLWGNGIDRKNRLEKAGYNYNTIQGMVNKLLK